MGGWRVRAGRKEGTSTCLPARRVTLQISIIPEVCLLSSLHHYVHCNLSTSHTTPMTTSTSTSPSSSMTDLPSSLTPLLNRDPTTIPLLPSKPFDATLTRTISSLAKDNAWSDRLTSSLHLLNDDVSRAHDIVTDREDDMGCCVVHAILHRRGEWEWPWGVGGRG